MLRRCPWLVLVAACGAPAPVANAPERPEVTVDAAPQPTVTSAPPHPSEPPPKDTPPLGLSAEQAATALFEAMAANDGPGMRRVTLSYDEMRTISQKDPGRDDYDDLVTAFIDGRLREFREAPGPVTFVRVEVAEQGTLEAADSEKLKKDLPYARIAPVFAVNGESRVGMPMLFVDPGNGFRFSVTN